MGDNDQEKTEKPSVRKMEKAKREGKIARTPEIPSVFILVASLGVLFFCGSRLFSDMSDFMTHVFGRINKNEFDIISLHSFVIETLAHISVILTPLMMAVIIGGIVGNIIQFGFVFTTKPFEPKFSQLNPISGFKKIVSLRSIVELLKALLKCAFIGGVAYYFLAKEMDRFPLLMQMEVNEIWGFIGGESFKICIYVCLALAVMSIVDFAYQKWQHQKDLMMTKQEIKDETRQSEGDPKIKGRIKQIQMENARRRMMEHVHEADLIVTNPTRLAIALKYEPEKMMAPKVLAKGAGYVADKIREIGKKSDVPIIENRPLAQALFKTVEIGDFIPVDLYRAVAELLAYVYKLKGNRSKV